MATLPQSEVGSCLPQTGTNDASQTSYANLMNAAAIAVAGINTAAAIRMAKLQSEIAQDYLDIAKSWRDYYNNTFRPIEDQELSEGRALTPYEPHFDWVVGQAKNTAKVLNKGKLCQAARSTNQYAVGLRAARIKDQIASDAFAIAASAGLGYRIELARKDALDDRRWKRLESILNRGRDMIAGNTSYSQLAAGIFGSLGAQAAEGASGAIRYLGYASERRPTVYSQVGVQDYPVEYANGRAESEFVRGGW